MVELWPYLPQVNHPGHTQVIYNSIAQYTAYRTKQLHRWLTEENELPPEILAFQLMMLSGLLNESLRAMEERTGTTLASKAGMDTYRDTTKEVEGIYAENTLQKYFNIQK